MLRRKTSGNPHTVRLAYFGHIADNATSLLRNAGLAGVLARSTSYRANLINAIQIAEQRGWPVVERHDKRSVHTDSIRIDVETDSGVTSVDQGERRSRVSDHSEGIGRFRTGRESDLSGSQNETPT